MLRTPVGRILISLLIVTTAVFVTFGSVLRNDFVNFDDQSEIIENPDFNPVTLEKLQWNWTHTRLTLYMPVTYMTWGAVASVARRDANGELLPTAFHALSLCLHLICSSLVFLLILRLWKRAAPALVGALVFAVHPIQVEAVAWASGMYTLLSTALSLAAMLAYFRYLTPSPDNPGEGAGEGDFEPDKTLAAPDDPHPDPLPAYRERGTYYWLATGLFVIALLTKAASVSLPLAAGVIDVFIIGRPLKKMIRSLTLWVLLGIPIVLLAKHFQDVSMITAPPLWARPLVAMDAIGFYIRKILFPVHLIPDYGRNPAWLMRHLYFAAIGSLGAGFVLMLAWVARHNFKWLTASIGVFIAGVLPYLGLTAFDFQYVSTAADRYAYFAMVGVALLAAGGASRSSKAMIGFIAAIFVWSVLSIRQVQYWKNSDQLFQHTLAINSNSLLSHNVFGYLAARQGRAQVAEDHYLQALKIWPENAVVHFNLANLYLKDQPERARQHYELAVRYQPHLAVYRNGLGASLVRLNRAQEACLQWKQAIIDDPNDVDPHNNLGDMFLDLDRRDAARAEFRAVLQIDPANDHALARLKEMEKRAR